MENKEICLENEVINGEVITQIEEDDDFDFDLSNMEVLDAAPKESVFGEGGALTIVNSAQNGNKRVMLSSKVHKELGAPDSIKVGFLSNTFVMGEHLDNGLNLTYKFRGKGKENSKRIIYNSDLVNRLTEKYSLDYSNGKVSTTFKEVRYKEIDGSKVAFIKMKVA